MAEVLVEFSDVVISAGTRRYTGRACGSPMESGQWQGWVEFVDLDTGEAVRTPRETTQPNRTDTVYWATGLTPVYLEGALQRALHPRHRRRAGGVELAVALLEAQPAAAGARVVAAGRGAHAGRKSFTRRARSRNCSREAPVP